MRPEFQGYFKDNFNQQFTPCFPLHCPDKLLAYSDGYTRAVPVLSNGKLNIGDDLVIPFKEIIRAAAVAYSAGVKEVIDITWDTVLTDPVVNGASYQYGLVVVHNDLCKSERYEKVYAATVSISGTLTANAITNALIAEINKDPNKIVEVSNNGGKLRLTSKTAGKPFYGTGITLGSAVRVTANVYASGSGQSLLDCGGKEDTTTPGNGVVRTTNYRIAALTYRSSELLGGHGDLRVAGSQGTFEQTVWVAIDTDAAVTAAVWTNALAKILDGSATAEEYVALM